MRPGMTTMDDRVQQTGYLMGPQHPMMRQMRQPAQPQQQGPPNYRPAEMQSCGMCREFMPSGQCAMYMQPVDQANTCDSFMRNEEQGEQGIGEPTHTEEVAGSPQVQHVGQTVGGGAPVQASRPAPSPEMPARRSAPASAGNSPNSPAQRTAPQQTNPTHRTAVGPRLGNYPQVDQTKHEQMRRLRRP